MITEERIIQKAREVYWTFRDIIMGWPKWQRWCYAASWAAIFISGIASLVAPAIMRSRFDRMAMEKKRVLINQSIGVTVQPPARAPAPRTAAAAKSGIFQMQIMGNAEFKKRVMLSLQMIWQKDKPLFASMKQYVYVIRPDIKTDFVVSNGVPAVTLSPAMMRASYTWRAGVLAHQYFHARQYALEEQQKNVSAVRRASGGAKRPPELMDVDWNDSDSIEKFERKADAFQLELMKKIGAPADELRRIRKRRAYDLSVAHDGK